MAFQLTGFSQISNVRQYAFRSGGAGSEDFVVSADMSLVLKHKIPMQELPLLCRRVLEGATEPATPRSMEFTEDDMLGYVRDMAQAAIRPPKERKRRVPVAKRAEDMWHAHEPAET